mmetsp:Transcript_32214/g.47593  ORF Transcript_32214/g.47593 Transcript_32214/m.47593 type:complete len:109 (-) Transcript_32214:293-619(-)
MDYIHLPNLMGQLPNDSFYLQNFVLCVNGDLVEQGNQWRLRECSDKVGKFYIVTIDGKHMLGMKLDCELGYVYVMKRYLHKSRRNHAAFVWNFSPVPNMGYLCKSPRR